MMYSTAMAGSGECTGTRWRRALVEVGFLTGFAIGCGDDGGEDLVDCASLLEDEQLLAPEDFVLDLRLAPFPGSGPTLGFDVDGTDEPVCGVDDRPGVAPGDPDGVDANLAANILSMSLVDRGFEESNTNILSLRLRRPATDVGPVSSCVSFELTVSRAATATFRRVDGAVFPGQRFLFADGPDVLTLPARRDRRLETTEDTRVWTAGTDAASLPFVIALEDLRLSTRIENLRVRIVEDPAGATALLGGSIDPTPVVDEVAMVDPPPVDPLLVRGVLNALLDVDPDPETGRCRRISLAALGDLVPAIIVEVTGS